MSSLADFVSEQRSKSSRTTTFNVANIGTKLGSSFRDFFRVDSVTEDCETLTDSPAANGQLPSARNRRTLGWLGGGSSDAQICFGLSRLQRFFAFFLFNAAAALFFGMSVMYLPVLVLYTRKFAELNTLGSLFFIASFGFLLGPQNYLLLLFSAQRRSVSAVYFTTIFLTLFSALWLQNTILTIVTAVLQAGALIWYLLTFVPGGETGLKWMARLSTSVCSLNSCGSGQASSKLVLPI